MMIWNFLFNKVCIRVWHLIIPILLGLAIFCYRGCGESKPIISDSNTLKPVIQKVDKTGKPYVEIKQEVYTKAQMKEITDSLRRNFKGKPQIKEVIRYVSVVDTSFNTDGPSLDTSNQNWVVTDTLDTKDIHIDYKGDLKAKDGTFNFQLKADTTTILSTVKNRFFRADERNIVIYHTNSLINTSVGSSYTEKIPKPIFVVSGGGYYDLLRNQWGFCISGGVPLFTVYNKK